jgi:prepilin-type N-terminal cleavage/methylation domain-containing protein
VADTESRGEVLGRQARARRDRGFSLVEVVVTITLMAIVIVPIMSAVAINIKSSSQGRSAAQVETALVNAADRVNRAPLSCDYSIYAQAAVQSQGWAPDRASVTTSYYVSGATPMDAGSWVVGAACESGMATPRPGLVQRVLISVTSPQGEVRREIQVVKSDV